MSGKKNDRWLETMIAKHGSREAVTKVMQAVGAKGGSVTGTQGGFATPTREERMKWGSIGGTKSKRGEAKKSSKLGDTWNTNQSSTSSDSTSSTPSELDNNFGVPTTDDLAQALIDEAQAIDRGEKSNRYETVVVDVPKPGLHMPKSWYEWRKR